MTGSAGSSTSAARAFAWAGGALFAASLAYFLFTYAVTFRESVAGRPAWRDVLFNVALFSAFAVHHSVFARTPLRRWVSRIGPAPLERSAYVWTASLMLILVCALWRPIAGVAWEVTGIGVWLLWTGILAGIWLTLRGAAVVDVWELTGIRAARPVLRGETSSPDFRVEGPYGWVRHPIYSGWFLVVFCVTPMTMTRLVFAVVSCAYLLVAIPLEERSLRATRGGAYERYIRQVRWKLLPWVYGAGWWVVEGRWWPACIESTLPHPGYSS